MCVVSTGCDGMFVHISRRADVAEEASRRILEAVLTRPTVLLVSVEVCAQVFPVLVINKRKNCTRLLMGNLSGIIWKKIIFCKTN